MKDQPVLLDVLLKIKGTKARKQLPITIFDLDDTLFSNAHRDIVIIHEFAADHVDEYPDFAELAARLTLQDMQWDVTAALIAAGLDKDSKSIPQFTDYWNSRFYTDPYCALDLPNPGAVDYVNACHDAGALVYYLTGRAVSNRGLNVGMEQGTVRALTTRGFPFWTGRCELMLKRDRQEKDTAYKERALMLVRSLRGEVVATFDNEPSNADMFQQNFSDADNFWVKTTWNPKDIIRNEHWIVISDFLCDLPPKSARS